MMREVSCGTEYNDNMYNLERRIIALESDECVKSSKDVVPLEIMRDVFDVKYNDELQENYRDILWCDLNENLKENLIEEIINGLKIENHRIPSRKALIKRANGFYNGRRMMAITKDDPLKRKRRKLAVKANRLTYYERERVCKEAMQKGTVNIEEMKLLRASVKQVPIESVSPPPSSDDEEAAQRRYDKRLQHLSKARLEKAKRRKEKVMAVSRSKLQLSSTMRPSTSNFRGQSRGACSVSVGYKKKSAIRFSPVFGSPESLSAHSATFSPVIESPESLSAYSATFSPVLESPESLSAGGAHAKKRPVIRSTQSFSAHGAHTKKKPVIRFTQSLATGGTTGHGGAQAKKRPPPAYEQSLSDASTRRHAMKRPPPVIESHEQSLSAGEAARGCHIKKRPVIRSPQSLLVDGPSRDTKRPLIRSPQLLSAGGKTGGAHAKKRHPPAQEQLLSDGGTTRWAHAKKRHLPAQEQLLSDGGTTRLPQAKKGIHLSKNRYSRMVGQLDGLTPKKGIHLPKNSYSGQLDGLTPRKGIHLPKNSYSRMVGQLDGLTPRKGIAPAQEQSLSAGGCATPKRELLVIRSPQSLSAGGTGRAHAAAFSPALGELPSAGGAYASLPVDKGISHSRPPSLPTYQPKLDGSPSHIMPVTPRSSKVLSSPLMMFPHDDSIIVQETP